MGFKKENYEVKSMGITLPQAYAVIREMTIKPRYCKATFAIHSTRDLALNEQVTPIETVVLRVPNDRTDPFLTAYAKAKEVSYIVEKDPETEEETQVEIKGPFAGWEDDIQAEA